MTDGKGLSNWDVFTHMPGQIGLTLLYILQLVLSLKAFPSNSCINKDIMSFPKVLSWMELMEMSLLINTIFMR